MGSLGLGNEGDGSIMGLGGRGERTDELGDEKTQSDPHRRDEVALVLFRRQHEDSEDELRGQDQLYNHSLSDCCSASEFG